jgi:hypothetical protein
LLLLAATGLVGVGLAVHGYGHGAVVVGGAGGVRALAPGAGSHARASAPTRSTSSSTASPGSSTAPSQKLGPLLSSTQYAPYAFLIYPGPESSQARLATTGFAIQVAPHAGKINLSVSVPGSGQAAQTSSFPSGDRVYFIEATLGDDSGGVEYSLGDDGVVVTNAQGYIVQ